LTQPDRIEAVKLRHLPVISYQSNNAKHMQYKPEPPHFADKQIPQKYAPKNI